MRSNKYKYAFLMLDIKLPNELCYIQNTILMDDIYDNELNEYGLEYEPHVTVYPCMDNDVNIQELLESLPKLNEFDLFVGMDSLSVFTMHDKPYDVLKLDIKSTKLKELNERLSKSYNSHSDYKDYNPHVTLAYMKKGRSDRYLNKLKSSGWLSIPSNYRFSWMDKDNNKNTITYIK